MAHPISEPEDGWETGLHQSHSQAPAFSGESPGGAPAKPAAQFVKLREYVRQMRGMLIDTEA